MKRYLVSLELLAPPESLVLIQEFLAKAGLDYPEPDGVLEAKELKRGKISIESNAPETSSIEDHFADLQEAIDFAELFDFLKSCGGNIRTYLRIGVLYYTVTCTVEISPHLLGQLSPFGIILEISCYPCEEKAESLLEV